MVAVRVAAAAGTEHIAKERNLRNGRGRGGRGKEEGGGTVGRVAGARRAEDPAANRRNVEEPQRRRASVFRTITQLEHMPIQNWCFSRSRISCVSNEDVGYIGEDGEVEISDGIILTSGLSWLSSVDINTQQSLEALKQRAVAVVVDPNQLVKGKVVIDAFRLINSQSAVLGQEPRQMTSNTGYFKNPAFRPSFTA
ncbi:hypothetical protein HK097_005021 [Rhizophlyctis rosea]|uniref:Uncharacterized protein n=1 Tax=Rhizophlyctis rosea TaxID=64517 RepID=A0AAD5SFB0_9FUNG|nr:hypothetical protein HK097_005021 [Rhizophlyctis rosea]